MINSDIVNAFTVDVEEHFQVAALKTAFDRKSWSFESSRVVRNTNRIIDLMAEKDVLGTFFILGWVAERHPQLVRRIVDGGHEVACHGYAHELVYEQSREKFKEETIRAKKILEDASGTQVIGYRAASYSITPRSSWALQILAEAGFQYDSSVIPVRHDIYGFVGAPAKPYELYLNNGLSLTEFPPSTVSLLGTRMPIGGGGYFRIYPYWFTHVCLQHLNKKGVAFSFYTHPWEVDPEQPRANVSFKSRFRHYTNLERCETRIRRLLGGFKFAPMSKVVSERELPKIHQDALLQSAAS